MISEIRSYYIPERVAQLDPVFLASEEEMSTPKDRSLIHQLLSSNYHQHSKLVNKHNSLILYATGLADDFDFQQGRSDTVGGTPPDADLDFASSKRQLAIDQVVQYWGRESVANILTRGKFKVKSVTEDYFRVMEPDPDAYSPEVYTKLLTEQQTLHSEIKKCIPPPLFGKEPSLDEVIKGNEDKNYEAHPQLLTERYAEWYRFAKHLEGMTRQLGIHAGGLAITNKPMSDYVPIWCNKDKEHGNAQRWITQFDMVELEKLGILKIDYLAIENLDIVALAVELIAKHHQVIIDPYNVPDGDSKSYELMGRGLLTGVFQLETSRSAKELTMAVKPTSVDEISDITALIRPGPAEAGYPEKYLANKLNQRAPDDMPKAIATILQKSNYTLVYQETVMEIMNKIGGLTLRETDNARKSLGKKEIALIKPYELAFLTGCVNHDIDIEYAKQLWTEILGFSSYAFNRSHSVN